VLVVSLLSKAKQQALPIITSTPLQLRRAPLSCLSSPKNTGG
jgi:hypothetical protein